MIVRIGEKIKQRTSVGKRMREGVVVAVNYMHGWYVVEFTTPKGKFRETYYMRELEGEEPAQRTGGFKSFWDEDPNKWLDDIDGNDKE